MNKVKPRTAAVVEHRDSRRKIVHYSVSIPMSMVKKLSLKKKDIMLVYIDGDKIVYRPLEKLLGDIK